MPGRILVLLVLAAVLMGGPATVSPPGPTRYPANAYPISVPFGAGIGIDGAMRDGPNEGIDIIARVRTPVYAAAHGEVALIGIDRRRGMVIEIRTTGADQRLTLVYAHLHAIEVGLGEPVVAGQRIGSVGDTGQVPRGIGHLHFELRAADGIEALDPEPLLRARPSGAIECPDPARAALAPDAGGYRPLRFSEVLAGAGEGAPLLYPVACTRGE